MPGDDFFFLIEIKLTRSAQAMGYRIEGDSGPGRNELCLGATILTRVPPIARGTWVAPHQPAVAPIIRGRLDVHHMPGGRRPPRLDHTGRSGIRDEHWR